MRLKRFLSKLLTIRPESRSDPAEAEALRLAFGTRYHHFKLLLNANNKALESMAEMEKALGGTYPFSFSFVRSKYTAVSVNVYQMIKHLNELAPDRYTQLYDRFHEIQKKIDGYLTAYRPFADKRLILPISEINRRTSDMVGSKMANLGDIKNTLGLTVPQGFAISAYAYARFFEANDLQSEIDRRFQAVDTEDMQALYTLSSEVQQLIIRAEIPPDVKDAITRAWETLEAEIGRPITAALRSSALGEDLHQSSFAGQYRSDLNVSRENLFQAYKEVVASKYSLQAITYRINKGFKDEDIAMPVGCLAMVNAKSGGVTYSRNPVDTGDDAILINAVWGLPKAVVDGSMDCDLVVVSRSPLGIIRQEIKEKANKYVCYPEEGICRLNLTESEDRLKPSVSEEQALSLARIAVQLENYYGHPQDIEWAVDESGELVILQCRPLKQIGSKKKQKEIGNEGEVVIVRGGVTAAPGTAWGNVYKVERGEDVLRFPKGAVLVARQAVPRWATLLGRASAAVTEQGGFAGHLANIAREFGIPALFGVENAVEKLQNGDLVTVDADGLTVYKGKIDFKTPSPEKKNLMEGSPVYETLKKISEYVVPLNLLDPDGLTFNPAYCKTFHDITRFVHEKAVFEMFNFGREHNFSERSGKQLYYKAPMQWWVLNLDDGFKEEVKGKHVRLENIACAPMLAFWEGFTAIPWEGPPGIDGKGLTSVLFRATTNTALTTGIRTKYSERNFFMISKNYCSLNSRLGFHFSILEALVSHREPENYISFQFKGGAADFERKLKRVMFIGEILEQYGFRVDIKEDTLISRLEGREKAFMLDRLKILGYLALHTRQLDMIMISPKYVNYYREKMKNEITVMLDNTRQNM